MQHWSGLAVKHKPAAARGFPSTASAGASALVWYACKPGCWQQVATTFLHAYFYTSCYMCASLPSCYRSCLLRVAALRTRSLQTVARATCQCVYVSICKHVLTHVFSANPPPCHRSYLVQAAALQMLCLQTAAEAGCGYQRKKRTAGSCASGGNCAASHCCTSLWRSAT